MTSTAYGEQHHGDLVFVYGSGPGLVTRLEGWALSVVELAFGDGPEATRDRKVAVFRDADGAWDIAATAVPLPAAEASWHLVHHDGRIVGGGPRPGRSSLSAQELEALRDSGDFGSLAGSVPVFGVPATAHRSPTVDTPAPRPPAEGTFTGARGGLYLWYTPQDDTRHNRPGADIAKAAPRSSCTADVPAALTASSRKTAA